MTDESPFLSVTHLAKAFGAVQAVADVSLTVRAGEIVGLVGDNGAGKSTLVKMLSGVHPPDGGQIVVDGTNVRFRSPADAKSLGVETVFQELALVETFGVAENFFLGREMVERGWRRPISLLRHRAMRRAADETIDRLKISLADKRAVIASMSGGQRQSVAIARAAFWKGRLLILDEPTAALGVRETAEVSRLLRHMARDEGAGLIVVSHDMEAVLDLCDRVVVLRRGRSVADLETSATTREELVAFITGAKA